MTLHGRVIKDGAMCDLGVGNYMLSLYVKLKDFGNAWKVFDEMAEGDVRCWTVLVSGFGSKWVASLSQFVRTYSIYTVNREDDEDEESLSSENRKNSSRFQALPRSNLSTGVNKLVKGFKSLSQLFIYEDEMDELGMEIGSPTDVKHITHIGWDSVVQTNPFMEHDTDMDITPASITLPTPPTTTTLMHFDVLATSFENDSPTVVSVNTSSSTS